MSFVKAASPHPIKKAMSVPPPVKIHKKEEEERGSNCSGWRKEVGGEKAIDKSFTTGIEYSQNSKGAEGNPLSAFRVKSAAAAFFCRFLRNFQESVVWL